MKQSNIALLTDVILITCVVDHGKGDAVAKAARGAGAGGALVHSSRGVGIRERVGLLGIAIEAEKDVVELLVGTDQADMVAYTIFSRLDLGRPGGGFIYQTPLDAAAAYLPEEIRARLKEKSA